MAPHDPNARSLIAAIIREVEVVGPDMAKVAERLGEPKEKVAREYRSKVEKNNFAVTVQLNRGALGLKAMTVVVEISPKYAQRANDLFAGMVNLWYLQNFARTYPDGKFILQFLLPDERVGEFPELMERMKKLSLVTKVYRTLEFSSRFIRPMSAEFFNFRTGRWHFDLESVPANPPKKIPEPTPRQRFSLLDLQVLFQTMMNAAAPDEEIAKALRTGIATAKAGKEHIAQMHLTKGWVVYWPKMQWNPATGVPLSSAHKYVFGSLSVERVTEKERDFVREKLNRIPTLWGEFVGRDYYADVALPPDQTLEGMNYVRKALEPVADRSNWYMLDPAFGYSFPPPLTALDGATGEWVFDLDGQMRRLEEQMKVVLEEARFPRQAVES